MQCSSSPEGVLLFALVKAHCAGLKPKARVAFLTDVAAVLADLENRPPSLRDPQLAPASAVAAAWFRARLPKLLA